MIPARMDHCATLMMSSAGRPSRLAWRWATQSPTTIEVAMRIPYQRTGNGPNPKIAGIWNAMAPGDANMTDYDKPWEAVSPRNATASAREPQGRNADQPARPREQRQDVFGTVVERAGRIVFPVTMRRWRHPSDSMQPRTKFIGCNRTSAPCHGSRTMARVCFGPGPCCGNSLNHAREYELT